MTLLISFFGFAGRMAGDLLTTALGWASSLLFGRVPRSHQVLLVLMMAFSFLWLILVLALVLPAVGSFLLSATPHPPFVDQQLLGMVILYSVLLLPLAVGLAGYLVPAEGEREGGLQMVRDVLRGYVLTPLLSGILIFLAGVGIVRKVRSKTHGWADIHVPVVMKQGGYDTVVHDLVDALESAGLNVKVGDAPRVLTAPAALLTAVSGDNVRKLRPDRLMEISARDLQIGIYPSDIAISGTDPQSDASARRDPQPADHERGPPDDERRGAEGRGRDREGRRVRRHPARTAQRERTGAAWTRSTIGGSSARPFPPTNGTSCRSDPAPGRTGSADWSRAGSSPEGGTGTGWTRGVVARSGDLERGTGWPRGQCPSSACRTHRLPWEIERPEGLSARVSWYWLWCRGSSCEPRAERSAESC